MGAAGTALGAADARTNEHYEIGTILTQKSQGVCTRIHRFPGSDPRGWPLGLAQNSCLIQMVLGIPVPAGPSPAVMATFRAANELLDLPPLHPPLVNACDQILTALHRLLTEADGIRAALELDEQLPLLRLIEEAED